MREIKRASHFGEAAPRGLPLPVRCIYDWNSGVSSSTSHMLPDCSAGKYLPFALRSVERLTPHSRASWESAFFIDQTLKTKYAAGALVRIPIPVISISSVPSFHFHMVVMVPSMPSKIARLPILESPSLIIFGSLFLKIVLKNLNIGFSLLNWCPLGTSLLCNNCCKLSSGLYVTFWQPQKYMEVAA
jgi:hypothetical protein